MKLLYFLFALLAAIIGAYFVINNFRFDSAGFSTFLIDTLFIALTGALLAGGLALYVNVRRKHHYKGVMTIRQYYDFKS